MSHTLLLNADYRPLSVLPLSTINWQIAIKLDYVGAANVVEYYDDWIVHSSHDEWYVPALMILSEYKKIKRTPKFSKQNIFLRDNYTCQYCSGKFESHELSKDHVIPKEFGGITKWTNITTACLKCNHKRGSNTKLQPRKLPYRPTYEELEAKQAKFPVVVHHSSWVPYLYLWNEETMIKKY